MQKHRPTSPLPLHQKRRDLYRRRRFFVAGVGLAAVALGLGTSFTLLKFTGVLKPASQDAALVKTMDGKGGSVLSWVALPAGERDSKLEAIAKGNASPDRNRARYLLAIDLITSNHGGQALPWLDDLEKDYPVLAAPILAKRAQAYTSTGDTAKAKATWMQLLSQYPKDPMATEALYVLGQTEPKYWDQAIAQFPAHPRTVEIALSRLQQKPDQRDLLLLVAQHGHYVPDVDTLLNRLKEKYGDDLTPQEWEAIAFNFWENGRYGSAGSAYAKAAPTALNLYRTARGAQLGGRGDDAVVGYKALLAAFPNEAESGLALLRLADLAEKPEEAVTYLDQAIQRFPEKAPEALLTKSKLLQNELNNTDGALQARQSVLSQYSRSETAADIRWEQAELNFQKGNTKAAWEWAQQLVKENADSTHAPQATFWSGKWSDTLGQKEAAQRSYEAVIANYPESYYAWRSANLLGWDVGDFTTVRQKLPHAIQPTDRPEPLAGSETAKELYRLGQDRDAWSYWQMEFTNRLNPTVEEQFTDGLMRLGINDNLNGIFMLSSLSWRDKPDEQKQYQSLRKQAAYWEALYPFPYMKTIEQWSESRRLNPMLVTALIRQESRFEAKIESVAGALGLMQVMPDTADWIANQINLKAFDLHDPGDNIKLGTWYLDYTHQQYDDNSLFAVASYNAGPGNVADWIEKFKFNDPDQFVEQIPFDETKGYVKSVFENYWNYLRLYNPDISQKLAKYSDDHADLIGENRF